MKSTLLKIAATSILLTLALLLHPNLSSAQQDVKKDKSQYDKQARHEQIEAQKIAFITQELNLTPEEAKVFWPVYNEYEAKRHELKKSFRNVEYIHKDDMDKLTEKEASQILDNQIIEAQKFLDLRKEYHAKFKAVLPAVKVLKLYGAERDFQKMLIDKIRQHKPTPPPADKK
jgi:hypothetical protein